MISYARIMEKISLKIHFWPAWLLLLSLSILFLSCTAFPKEREASLRVNWSPKEVNQGEICVVNVLVARGVCSVAGECQERDLSFYETKKRGGFRSLVGFDLEADPGTCQLTISARDRSGRVIESKHRIRILRKDFGTQRLTLPREMVELDKKTLKRVDKESKKVKEIWKKERRERFWHGKFMKPVNGKVLSLFGVRRILNNSPRNPHSGIDLRARMGEDVRCSNAGIVVLADELYFSGKSVIVDHGQGLYTMYFHLSRMYVKEGQEVNRGEVLGLVGSSGRATGPHLHWGVCLRGARVDPFCLLKLR